ncbi:MAG: hypothetical protein ACRDU8_10320, partial [Egibacteraceae bacterium]
MLRRSRPLLRNVVTALCVVAILLPPAAGAAAGPESELDEVNDKLDDARSKLGTVERRKQIEVTELERI